MPTDPTAPRPRPGPASSRPTLLVVTWQLQPYGGLETRLSTLVRSAVERGWKVALVSARPVPPTGTAGQLASMGADVTVLQDLWAGSTVGRAAIAVGRARDSVRSRALVGADPERHGHRSFTSFVSSFWTDLGADLLGSADVVHLVGAPKDFLAQTLSAAADRGLPVAYQSVHQVDARYASRRQFAAFREACDRCSVIFTSHDRQAQDFRDHFGYRGRTLTVPQWCYEDEARLLALAPAHRRDDEPLRVGALARFDAVKGLDTVVDAVGAAVSRGVRCELVLGGTGPLQSELMDRVDSLGLDGVTEWSGFVTDRATWFGGIHTFVLASSAEGGPITGVEAMAAARAIVTTPVGAMPERLDDRVSGRFFAPGDPDRLAAHLSELATDDALLSALAVAARDTYTDRFAASLHSQTMLDELSLLARH